MSIAYKSIRLSGGFHSPLSVIDSNYILPCTNLVKVAGPGPGIMRRIFVFVLVIFVFCTFCSFALRRSKSCFKGHLFSNQLFCFFGVFVFVVSECEPGRLANCFNVCQGVKQGVLEGTLFLLDEQMVNSFERLMCEVEFWEVFLKKELGFLAWLPQGARC